MSDLKKLDWELISDITFFKQNDISHLSHIVQYFHRVWYDIKKMLEAVSDFDVLHIFIIFV